MKRLNFVAALSAVAATVALPMKVAAVTHTAARAPIVTMTIREALKANGVPWEAALAKTLHREALHDGQVQVYGFTRNHAWAADPQRIVEAEARAAQRRAWAEEDALLRAY